MRRDNHKHSKDCEQKEKLKHTRRIADAHQFLGADVDTWED